MVEHCRNCYCEPEKVCFFIQRKLTSRICCGFATLLFIAMAILMCVNVKRTNFQGWSEVEYHAFVCLLSMFSVCVSAVLVLELYMMVEFFGSIVCGIYAYFCDFIRFLRRHLRIPSWQNIQARYSRWQDSRARYSRQSAFVPSGGPSSDVDTDEEPPELPPKSGFILRTVASQPSQRLPDIEQGPSTSAARSDRRQAHVDPRDVPSCSGIQFASTSQKRSKPRTRKERFRKRLGEVRNLRTIDESQETSGSQELPQIEIPLSVLLKKPQTSRSTTRETSFCSDSDTPEEEAQASEIIVEVECHEHAPVAGVSGLQGQVREAGIESLEKKQKSSVQPSAVGYVGFSALQSQARMSDDQGIQRTQEGREQISVAQSSGLQRQARASGIQMKQESGVQISTAGSSGSQRQIRPSGFQTNQEIRLEIPTAGSSEPQRQAGPSGIQMNKDRRVQISTAGSSGLQRQAGPSGIQMNKDRRVQISTAGSSGLQRQAGPSGIQMNQESGVQIPVASSSGLQRQAEASDIQKRQKSREQSSAAGFHGLGRAARESGVKETENKPEGRAQTSAAGYVGFSGLERQARKSDIEGIQKRQEGRGQGSSIGYSGLERTEGGSKTKQLQREEKTGKNTSEEERASTSGLTSRHKLTSTQETEINSPRTNVQRELEKDRSVQKSPKEDTSMASLEGAVGQQTQKTGAFLSLNLTGGNLVVSTPGADEVILSSGMDPGVSDFFFDQPMSVLDLSHIEVPIRIETEEEAKDEDDKKNDDDKKKDESKNE